MVSQAQKSAYAAVLTLGLTVMASSTYAQGLRNPPESASGLALGGGRYSLVDDASALSLNPANVAGATQPSVMGSFTYIHTDVDYDSKMGRSGHSMSPDKYLPNVHALLPVKDQQWVLGLGVTTPFGQSTDWGRNGPFAGIAPYHAEMMLINVNPTLATKLGDHLSIGVGLDVIYSELDLRQDIPFSAVLGIPVPNGSAKLQGDDTAVGANIGVAWTPAPRHRLSAAYRTPFDVKYSGHTDINNIPPPLAGALAPRSDFDTEIKFPSIVALGYACEVTETLSIGVDVEWLEWSRYENLPIDLGINGAAGLFPPNIPQGWDDTWHYGLGVEWDCKPGWTVRGGWVHLESPIPDRTVAPTLTDADREVFSLGLGRQVGSHGIDLAYAYNLFDDLDVKNNQNPLYNGDYDLSSQLFTASYSYSF